MIGCCQENTISKQQNLKEIFFSKYFKYIYIINDESFENITGYQNVFNDVLLFFVSLKIKKIMKYISNLIIKIFICICMIARKKIKKDNLEFLMDRKELTFQAVIYSKFILDPIISKRNVSDITLKNVKLKPEKENEDIKLKRDEAREREEKINFLKLTDELPIKKRKSEKKKKKKKI